LKILATISFFIFLLSSAVGQNLYYEIVRGESQIGVLEVLHERTDSLETYRMRNLVEFKILFTFSVEYVLTESFADGVLVSGEGFNTLNGSSQRVTRIKLARDGYHLIIDGVEGHNEKSPIKASMAKIYHEELHHGKKLYSQYFGCYLTAEKVGDHKYIVRSPDGENVYEYKDGYCAEVKVIRDFATFYIRMKPETLASIARFKEVTRD
jgi:hypothetical protein